MRHPTTVVAIGCIAVFVRTNTGHRNVVLLRIILDWNQGTHTANRRGIAVVASLQQQQGIRPHERCGHRDLGAIGQTEVAVDLELLDARENVIPAAGIQPCRVLAQLIQNFVHFKGRNDRLNQHGRLDTALGNTDRGLRRHEHIVPKSRLEMTLELGQVEVRPKPTSQQLFSVMKHVQRKIKQAARDALSIDGHMFLIEMPATRTHD